MLWQCWACCWCHLCSSSQPVLWTRNTKWCLDRINVFTDHTHRRVFFLDKQLWPISTQPRGIGNVRKESLELGVHWWNGKESLEFRIYRWDALNQFGFFPWIAYSALSFRDKWSTFHSFSNCNSLMYLCSGGMGKRAWNSGFTGGMGKRAWNSGFTGGMGKRAWNSGFTGKVDDYLYQLNSNGYGQTSMFMFFRGYG